MKKNIIWIIMILLLPIAFALTDGQVLNQSQVDDLTKNESLSCRNEGFELLGAKIIQVSASCLTLQATGNNFVAVREKAIVFSASFGEVLAKYFEFGGNANQTISFFKETMRSNFLQFKKEKKQEIASLQTNNLMNAFGNAMTISNSDLNS